MIKAEIIADSIHPIDGTRLTSFVLRFPRIVLAEFNTHRALSRNSSSSRAIPFATMLESVKNDPFIPLRFQQDHSGMQGEEYYEGVTHEICVEDWLKARDAAVSAAEGFVLPVTKQLRNRLLEPFLWHTVIATGTNWQNFFALRAHEAAEIHIQDLAYKALDAYNESTPKILEVGDWHIPFGDKFDEERLMKLMPAFPPRNFPFFDFLQKTKVHIATARCARVSYLNFEGKDDYSADLALYERLSKMGHWSPFEHCAEVGTTGGLSGNFDGCWVQLRKTFKGENKTDSRVI